MRQRRPLLVAVVSVAVLAGWVSATPAAGAAGCRADQVTVVVDFGSLGGGSAVRCVTDPTSGLDALAKAGFGYGFRPGFPGMVCTIDARPDPCNGAPADAYWAYWYGPAGGGWTYATQGAGSRTPPPGSVEGWAFGDDRRPSVSPPASTPPPTVATTAPPTSRSPAPPPAQAVSPAPPAPAAGPGGTASTVTSAAPTSTAPTTDAADPAAPTTTSPPGGSAASDREATELAVDRTSSTGGGATGALVGLAVLVAVAAAAGWEFRRRRLT